MHEKSAFYAIKSAVERSHPDMVDSIQGRQEIERVAREIMASIKQAGLRLVRSGNEERKERGAARPN